MSHRASCTVAAVAAAGLILQAVGGDAGRPAAGPAFFEDSTPRHALFWMEPYANVTSIAGYQQIWHQWKDHFHPGYIMAGSAYDTAANGSLVLAVSGHPPFTKEGELMEKFGFPAMVSFKIPALAMVYVTHIDAIKAVTANPKPWIQQLLAKAKANGLAGFDIDYEPQAFGDGQEQVRADDFMALLTETAAAMKAAGLMLTIDIGGCPQFDAFDCAR